MSAPTHPPSANKLVMVDFDGTLMPWGPLMDPGPPYPGIRDALTTLKRAGYTIGVFTSRLSPAWLDRENRSLGEQYLLVKGYMQTHLLPFDFITAEKLPAEAYFDDKAYRSGEGQLPFHISLFIAQSS